jgi:hypothetical protein
VPLRASILPVIAALVICIMGCYCENDIYGGHLELEVPIDTYPAQDTFTVGDTLWIEADFIKYVKVRNNAVNSIYLDQFQFFTDFFISEISDTIEKFEIDIELIEITGTIEKLYLPTAIVYPMNYVEDENNYRFKAGIVLNEKGLFYAGFSTSNLLYEFYNHPAVFLCKSNRRYRVDVYYTNHSTSIDVYSSLFLTTGVDYLNELVDFERYSNTGTVAFYVQDP